MHASDVVTSPRRLRHSPYVIYVTPLVLLALKLIMTSYALTFYYVVPPSMHRLGKSFKTSCDVMT
jgi:hypothetical protein